MIEYFKIYDGRLETSLFDSSYIFYHIVKRLKKYRFPKNK